MNRRLILATLLAMLLAACGQQESSEPDATLTPEATPEATSDAPTPSDEPAASEDDGSASGDLADVIPDELNGVPRHRDPGHGPDPRLGAPGARASTPEAPSSPS